MIFAHVHIVPTPSFFVYGTMIAKLHLQLNMAKGARHEERYADNGTHDAFDFSSYGHRYCSSLERKYDAVVQTGKHHNQ